MAKQQHTWFFMVATVFFGATCCSAQSPPATLVIEGCAVFDPDSQSMRPNQTIIVRGETIASVTPVNAAPPRRMTRRESTVAACSPWPA